MTIIYGLIDNETLELRYVGQTTKALSRRLSQHKRERRRRNIHLANWLLARPVNITPLEYDPEDINEAERRWIREKRKQGARLLNLTDGGQCGVPSAETRAAISTAMMGHTTSAETRAKISMALMGNQHNLGHKHTTKTRTKMSVSRMGHPVSAETRAKISVAGMGHQKTLGYKHTLEARRKISAAMTGNQHGLRRKHVLTLATPTRQKVLAIGLNHVAKDKSARPLDFRAT